jgi:hypothetical protein
VTVGRLAAELPAMVAAGVRLVVIDPLASLAEEGSDWTSEGSARQCLDQLVGLAEEHRLAIIASRNWNKRKTSNRLDRIMGSAAFRDVPRSIISCIDHPTQRGQYVLCHDKWSASLKPAWPICYDLAVLDGHAAPVWRQLEDSSLAGEELDSERMIGGERREWQAAHELIRGMVGDEGCEASKIYSAAGALGIGKGKMWRAANELGVRHERVGFGPGSHVRWNAPKRGWPEGLTDTDSEAAR